MGERTKEREKKTHRYGLAFLTAIFKDDAAFVAEEARTLSYLEKTLMVVMYCVLR